MVATLIPLNEPIQTLEGYPDIYRYACTDTLVIGLTELTRCARLVVRVDMVDTVGGWG